MLSPERGLDNTRSHGRDSDPKLLVEIGERPHEAANSVFRGAVNRGCEIRILACNAGNMDDMLRATAGTIVQEMSNRQLCRADRVGDVDIDQSVSAARGRVLTCGRVRRAPEVAPMLYALQLYRLVDLLGLFLSYRLVDTRARANNINLAELFLRNLEHPLELDPVNHISL